MRDKDKIGLAKWLVVVAVLSLIIIWPMFRPGYWESDDGEWMVIRFSAFHESLRDGHFPVRWTLRLNHHYGYPVLNFLYPLPFYLAEIPHLAGFGFVDSVKIVFGGSVVLAAIGMFLFARKWGDLEALVASSVYLLAPYRTFLLYTRGSLGESLALAAAPFISLFADRVRTKANWQNIFGLAVAYAALIMSHNVIALLFTPLLFFYIFNQSKTNLSAIRYPLSAILLGIALSAFFWIPALFDLRYTRALKLVISEYQNYYLSLSRLINLLGIVPLTFVMLGALKKQWFFFSISLIAAFLMHKVSDPLVNAFPLIEKIQFPWRIATLFMFSSAASAGWLLKNLRFFSTHRYLVATLTLVALLVSILPSTKAVKFVNREEGFYTTNDDTTTVKNEFTPIWVKADPKQKPDAPYEIEATPGSYEIINKELRTGKYYLQIRLKEPTTITFHTHYFPGWRLYVDGESIELDPKQTDGLLRVEVTPGTDKLRDLEARFEPTPVRRVSETISLLAAASLIAVAIFKGLKAKTAVGIGVLSLAAAFVSLGFFVFTNLNAYREIFDPQAAEAAYLNSQWVNPDFATNVPIGDHGLYSWAGWAYIHGENPILINSEMPPLGKYIIGIGLLFSKRAAVVGLILSLFALITHFFLAREVLKSRWLAITATSLFSLEPVMRNLANITMLDGLHVGFLNLTFLFFIKGLKEKRWFTLSSIMLGAFASTKFFASAVSVTLALLGFLAVTRKWEKLKFFLVTLPLAGLVHAASYAAFFAQGGSLRGYLGAQKWIFNFYRQGNVGTVPPGSYWLLVLFNRWRVWFGQEWGVFTTIKSDLWRFTWPVNVFGVAAFIYIYLRKKLPERFGVFLIWLAVYSLFLTFIIGWPHYMLLFLPYSYIILIEIGRRVLPDLSRHFQTPARHRYAQALAGGRFGLLKTIRDNIR